MTWKSNAIPYLVIALTKAIFFRKTDGVFTNLANLTDRHSAGGIDPNLPFENPTAFFFGVTSRICRGHAMLDQAPRVPELIVGWRDGEWYYRSHAPRALSGQIARNHFLLDCVIPGKAQGFVGNLIPKGDLTQRAQFLPCFSSLGN